MNNRNKKMELSYYGLYLLAYLKENHPDKTEDTEFIETRADLASKTYEQARLEGYAVESAQELAMAVLLQGLHFSKYNTIIEILWNEFENEVLPGDAPDLALEMLPFLEEIFSQYPLSDDFSGTSEYEALYTELTGAILLYSEGYGI
jgi:hypothetical protein